MRAPRSTARLVALALTFAIIASVIAARTVRNLNVPGNPGIPRYGMEDFRDAIYYPAVALLDGHNPYDVRDYLSRYPVGQKFSLYAPVVLALYLPLAVMSQAHAEYVFFLLNLALTLVVGYYALRISGTEPSLPAILGIGTLLLMSHPGQLSAFLGQSTTYIVIGVYLALLFARERPWVAASGLALACLKPTFGVPTAILLLAMGQVRVVARGVAIAAAGSAVVSVFLIHHVGGVGVFIASLWGNYAMWDETFINSARSNLRIDVLAFVGRLLGRNLTAVEDLLLTATVLGLGALAVHRVGQGEDDDRRALAASVACMTILAGVYHNVYDALILAAPAVALAGSLWSRATRLALAVLIAVPAVNYVATDTVINRFHIEGAAWVAVASLNGTALLGAFGLVLWTAFRQPSAANQAPADGERFV